MLILQVIFRSRNHGISYMFYLAKDQRKRVVEASSAPRYRHRTAFVPTPAPRVHTDKHYQHNTVLKERADLAGYDSISARYNKQENRRHLKRYDGIISEPDVLRSVLTGSGGEQLDRVTRTETQGTRLFDPYRQARAKKDEVRVEDWPDSTADHFVGPSGAKTTAAGDGLPRNGNQHRGQGRREGLGQGDTKTRERHWSFGRPRHAGETPFKLTLFQRDDNHIPCFIPRTA